jgi:hypothetical protein
MRMRTLAMCVVALLGVAAVRLSASGQAGIYAAVERVVFEPATGPADRVQVWGAFALMERSGQTFTGYVYRQPVRGYLYFRLPADSSTFGTIRAEWKDLASVAGTKQAIAFGYWDSYAGHMSPSVRSKDAPLQNPDDYLTNVGMVKLGPTNPVGQQLIKLLE